MSVSYIELLNMMNTRAANAQTRIGVAHLASREHEAKSEVHDRIHTSHVEPDDDRNLIVTGRGSPWVMTDRRHRVCLSVHF